MAGKRLLTVLGLALLWTGGSTTARADFFTDLKACIHNRIQAHFHCPKPEYYPHWYYTAPCAERARQCFSGTIPYAYPTNCTETEISVQTIRYQCPPVDPAISADVYLRSGEPANQYPKALPTMRESEAPK